MEPMPKSFVLLLSGIAILGVLAVVLSYVLTPVPPTVNELADQARRLSDEIGLDRAETEKLLSACNERVDDHGRLWAGLESGRYEACLREAHLLD